MAWGKDTKSEAGNGGKLGHSNQSHWSNNTFVKEAARRARRSQNRTAARTWKAEY